MDDGDKVGKIGENLLKVDLLGACFLISEANIAFLRFRKAFTEVLIFHYFDLEPHIQIETDAFSFAINGIFCQLSLKYVTYINPDFSIFKIGK